MQPYYDREENRQVGYIADNTMRIRITDLERIGAVIDAALAAGADDVRNVHFTSPGLDVARRAALVAAVEQAQEEAAALAPQPAVEALVVERGATAITPGEQTVSATVVGRWRFEPTP